MCRCMSKVATATLDHHRAAAPGCKGCWASITASPRCWAAPPARPACSRGSGRRATCSRAASPPATTPSCRSGRAAPGSAQHNSLVTTQAGWNNQPLAQHNMLDHLCLSGKKQKAVTTLQSTSWDRSTLPAFNASPQAQAPPCAGPGGAPGPRCAARATSSSCSRLGRSTA